MEDEVPDRDTVRSPMYPLSPPWQLTSYSVALLLAIEYAWNVFPSTNLSSGILVAANAALLLGIWFGYPEGQPPSRPVAKTE